MLSLIFADIIHFIKFLIIGDYYLKLEYKNAKVKRKIYSSIIVIIGSCLANSTESLFLNYVYYVAAMILALIVIYDEKIVKLIITGIWITIAVSLLDVMSKVMVSTIFSIVNANNESINTILSSMLSLVIVWIAGTIIKNKKGLSGIKNIYFVGFMILEIIDMIVLVILAEFVINVVNSENDLTYSIIYILMIIGVYIQLIAVISLMVSRNEHREKELVIKQYLNEQTSHYAYLEQRERETKKFRHDLKSHMHMLKVFSENGEYKKLDEYLKMINENVDAFTRRISVNNDIVDAIVNKYYSEAKNNNIKMEVQGHFPRQCSVSAYDLCTVFSNLLSNALEAAKNAERKEISVSCRYKDEDIIVIISNYYSGEVKFENGRLKTSKNNVSIHGFGLENVEGCVENNGGYIKIDNKNNIFAVTILLKNLHEEAK